MITRETIRAAVDDAPVDALVTKAHADKLTEHLFGALNEPDDGARDWGVRVTTSEADRVLVLPTPSREQASTTAGIINADSNKTRAELVWRPAGGWRAEA